MVREGTFREDLYHRLNVLAIHVPPLRERLEDLQPFIEHFLTKYSSLNNSFTPAVSDDFLRGVATDETVRKRETVRKYREERIVECLRQKFAEP